MWDYRTEIYTIGSRKRWPSPQIQKLSSFVSFFWLSHVACRILVSHLGMESWHWKHQVLTPDNHGIPRKSPLITGTSPTLLCDLCSCHPPFFPSTPTMPAFILFPEYVTLISTHRAFAVPSVMDSSAKYLCVAASFLSDQVSSSQKKKKKSLLCFTIYAMACFCRATSKLTLWCLPERTYGCWNGLVCVFSCPASNSQIRPQPL